MSAQQQPAVGAGAAGNGQRQVFRSVAATVVWWVWVAFAIANIADLSVQAHNHFSAEVSAVLVAITGIMYACALRPQVVADDSGISVTNPLREHTVPWGAVTGVDLGDSLQVHARRPEGGEKVIYSWAVQSSRRGRARAGLRARRTSARMERQSPGYARLPAEAKDIRGKTHAELTVVELTQRLETEQSRAKPTGTQAWAARWAWWQITVMVVPAIAAVVVILA